MARVRRTRVRPVNAYEGRLLKDPVVASIFESKVTSNQMVISKAEPLTLSNDTRRQIVPVLVGSTSSTSIRIFPRIH